MSIQAGKEDGAAAAESPPTAPHRRAVSGRAIALGALLIPVNCYWMAVMELQWNSLDSTCVSIFFHVIFLTVLLTAANALLARRFPRIAFTPGELLTVYVMLSIASAVMGRDSMENLPPLLGFMRWYDDPNRGYSRFLHFVPRWIAPTDRGALRGYYIGASTLYSARVLAAWLPCMIFWIAFVVVLSWMMLCINVLMRRRWMEEERLTFPLVQLPVAITNTQTFNSRALWVGVAIPFLLQSLNNISYLHPTVPGINLKLRDWGPLFPTPPWNGLGWFPVAFFPFAIGFAYFLPTDLSFSCWFFYLLRKLVDVACVAWGLRDPWDQVTTAKFPYVAYQGTGAWIGLSIALVWLSRSYLAGIIRGAFSKTDERDTHSGMSYRTALLGLAAGQALLIGACWASGMSLWLPFVYLAFYFIISIGITRVRAELGPPAHELNWVNPERFMVTLIGAQTLGRQNLTLLSYMFWFNRGYRSHPMPHQMEAMKATQADGVEARRLTGAIMLATALGAAFAFWAMLDMMYRNGEATPHIMSYGSGIGREAADRLSDWAANPRKPDGTALFFTFLGAAATLGLAVAKSRFFWWPFHPIGYALANSYALEYFWFTILLGWSIKYLVIRYGGVRGYRMAIPFFLGVILGDYVVAALWSLVGWVMGISTYRTFIF